MFSKRILQTIPRLPFFQNKHLISTTPGRQLKVLTKYPVGADQLAYMDSINPGIADFLTETIVTLTTITGKPRGLTSLMQRIYSYKTGYVEKAVLIDPGVAAQIANYVLIHSERGADTVFYDGEGGLCYIAREILESGQFKSVKILEKDKYLEQLHDYAKNSYLKDFDNYEITNINFTKIASDALACGYNYVSPFQSEIRKSNWEDPEPTCTIVTTASQGFIKYLTLRCLYRSDIFSEFSVTRPEFFFLVSMRTWMHMTCGLGYEDTIEDDDTESCPPPAKLMLPLNVLFQMLFEYSYVDVIPRKAYIPWKKYTYHNKVKRITEQRFLDNFYESEKDTLVLVHSRPRVNSISKEHCFNLEYFLTIVLKNKATFLVPMFEKWLEGSGLDVIEAGYNVLTEIGDLNISDISELFYILMEHPELKNSNFLTEVSIWKQGMREKEGHTKHEHTNNLLVEIRREIRHHGPARVEDIYQNATLDDM